MAQPHTKARIRDEVPAGLISPIVNQMPTPEIAPNTSVIRMKNRACRSR
jgi:hypothetical protein